MMICMVAWGTVISVGDERWVVTMTPFFGRLGETVRGLVGDFWRLFFFL